MTPRPPETSCLPCEGCQLMIMEIFRVKQQRCAETRSQVKKTEKAPTAPEGLCTVDMLMVSRSLPDNPLSSSRGKRAKRDSDRWTAIKQKEEEEEEEQKRSSYFKRTRESLPALGRTMTTEDSPLTYMQYTVHTSSQKCGFTFTFDQFSFIVMTISNNSQSGEINQ